MTRLRTADCHVWTKNACGEDAGAGFGCAVGGAEAGEDDGGDAAHGAEEGLEGAVRRGLLLISINAYRVDRTTLVSEDSIVLPLTLYLPEIGSHCRFSCREIEL